MKGRQTLEARRSVARALAPEEIRPGHYVSVLHVVEELLPLIYYLEGKTWRPVELLRVQHVPRYGQIVMKVLEVCLPFVLVRQADGEHRTLDVRRHRLARITARFGRAAFAAARAKRKRERRKDDDEDDDADC